MQDWQRMRFPVSPKARRYWQGLCQNMVVDSIEQSSNAQCTAVIHELSLTKFKANEVGGLAGPWTLLQRQAHSSSIIAKGKRDTRPSIEI